MEGPTAMGLRDAQGETRYLRIEVISLGFAIARLGSGTKPICEQSSHPSSRTFAYLSRYRSRRLGARRSDETQLEMASYFELAGISRAVLRWDALSSNILQMLGDVIDRHMHSLRVGRNSSARSRSQ